MLINHFLLTSRLSRIILRMKSIKAADFYRISSIMSSAPQKRSSVIQWIGSNKKSKPDELVFEVLYKSKPKRSEKFKMTEKSITFQIKNNLYSVVNLFQIKEELIDKFNELINELKQNEDPNNFINIEINTPKLNNSIFIGQQKIKDFDKDRDIIFNRINKYIQSAKEFFIDGIIDLRVIIVENIRGVGAKKNQLRKAPKTKEEISTNKRSVVMIKNDDNLCAFRAFFVSMYHYENKNGMNEKEWKSIRQDRRKLQTKGGLDIARKCALENCEAVGNEEWNIIQQNFPQYQIRVIDGSMKDNIIFSGPENRNKIFIEYLNNHFNAIINIRGYMTRKFYCETCHVKFSHLFDHRCKDHCKNCYEVCEKCENEINCDECKRTFKGLDCYNRHINNKICKYIKLCDECGVTYKDKNKEHVCDKYLCKKCYVSYDEQPHYCYISPKKIEELQKEDDINKIIVAYDIESTQENGEHVPNLLMQKTKCDKCADSSEQCDLCNVNKPEYFSGKSCIKDFAKYLFFDLAKKSEESKSMIYAFAHNARGYDAQFILRELWSHNFNDVSVIMRGRKILIIRCGNIKLLDSLNYFLLPLSDLPKAFGLDVSIKKGDFPHFFNKPENYNYQGIIPDLEYFNPEYLSPKKRNKLIEWHSEYRASGNNWIFMEELISYCKNDVEILMLCVMKFRELFKAVTTIDPITRTFTLASIGLETFKAGILPKDTLAISPVQGYSAVKNHSKAADCWLDYIQKSQRIKLKREFRIGKYWVDGFDLENNTVYEFSGCLWHGHHCIQQNDIKLNELKSKLEYLENRDFTVVHIWECEFREEKSKNSELKNYYNQRYVHYSKLKKHGHADIRESFFGGRTNNLQFYRKAEEDERIEYLDVCSLYPYVLRNRKYPIGHPDVIREDFDYSLKSYFGFVKCRILPLEASIFLYSLS